MLLSMKAVTITGLAQSFVFESPARFSVGYPVEAPDRPSKPSLVIDSLKTPVYHRF